MSDVVDRSTKREETAAVRRYLEFCSRPVRRGRPVTAESVRRRLAETEQQFAEAPASSRPVLAQRLIDLQDQLEGIEAAADADALEADFVAHAWNWAARKGISYAALRASGVPARVLRDAGF